MEEQYRGSEDQGGKNHAHGDRLTMDEDYKGHHIRRPNFCCHHPQ
jgi:hypothetical protein